MGTVLLEREAGLRTLRDALDDAAKGAGCCVIVFGEAGIGKTSLVRAFQDEARDRARVWVGGCEDLLTPRTLGPFRDMARQAGGAVRESLQAASDAGELADVLLDELGYPLEPTVAIIEDAHWADDATLDVVRMVSRRIAELPGALVVTYRDDELTAAHPLQRVLGALTGASTRRVPLRRLSAAAVQELAGDEAVATEVFRVTGGNPFFATEVIAAGRGQLPMTVRDAVHARLQQLSPEGRHALELLSVVPAGADRALVDALLGSEAVRLAEAEERGLLQVDPGSVRFRHELMRRALESSLPVSLRIHHHRLVVEALVAADADASQVLHHAIAAGDGDRVAVHGPVAARQAARAGSHRQAVSHYAATLRYADRLSPEAVARLQAEYGYELYHIRRFADAAEHAAAAVAAFERLADTEELGQALVTLSRATYWKGDTVGAREAAERAVAVAEPRGRTTLLAAAEVALAHVLMQADDLEALTWAERALELGRELDREDVTLQALSYLGTVRMGRGLPDGEEQALTSLRLAEQRGDDVAVTRVCANLVRDLIRLGRLRDADRYMELGLAHARRAEFAHGLYNLRTRQAELHALRGHWEDADGILLELSEGLPDTGINSSLLLAWRGRIAARRGDPHAGELLDAAWTVAAPTGELQWIGPVAAARVEAAWLAGDAETARRAAAPALDDAERLHHPWLHGELRRYLARAGDVVETVDGCAEAWRLGLARDWTAAADAWLALGNPYERALELAEIPAEPALLEAIEILDGLGAVPAARIARQRLRALGVTRIPRGPQAQTRENPAGLTARQVDVLALVAEGLTNAQIADRLVVSVRTVDHHVAAVLDKLGVTSRRDAARLATGLGIPPAASS
jgi:DNA-binding CsgD family transcriptional regulator/tetratricopeptide (TPR) repeat protein